MGAAFRAWGASTPTSRPAPASQPAPPAPSGMPSGHPTLPPSHPQLPSGHPGTPAEPPGAPAVVIPPRPIVRGPSAVKKVQLEVAHRVFHNFAERCTAVMYQEFPIGDTDYTGELVEYVPDFAMNLKTFEVTSRSNEPNNPALRILVRQKGVPQDTTWAFLNMPPHFARKSLLAFMVTRLEIKGHKPIVARPATSPPGQGTPGAKKS